MVLRDISLSRLADRKSLLHGFDQFRRETDAAGTATAMDAFNEQALGLLTSSRLAEALDISAKHRPSSNATAPATRKCLSTTTALRACRKVC